MLSSLALALRPAAKRFDMLRRAVAEPTVELGGVLELLATEAGDGEVAGVGFGEGGEVAPEFLELSDGKDVFLPVSPALFDIFQGDVGGEALGEAAEGSLDDVLVILDDVLAG